MFMVRVHTVHLINVEKCQAKTISTELGAESARRLLSSAPTMNVQYYLADKFTIPNRVEGWVDKVTAVSSDNAAERAVFIKSAEKHCLCHLIWLFRSTPKSRPNNLYMGLRCPSVRPQKVFPIPMKFGMYVEVDEWCTMVYQGHETFKVRNSSIFKI